MIIEYIILSTRQQCQLDIELVFNSRSHSFHVSTCQCYNEICFLKIFNLETFEYSIRSVTENKMIDEITINYTKILEKQYHSSIRPH